jgi:hypothetical protein
MIGQCSSCGSKRLVRGHMAVDGWSAPIGFHAAGASMVSRKAATTLICVACADCGNVHVVAADLAPLNPLWEDQSKGSLRLSE